MRQYELGLKDFISSSIVKEVKEAKYFTVIADETPDVSRKEQLAISLRYVDKERKGEVFPIR